MSSVFVLVVSAVLCPAAGHGQMVFPPTRFHTELGGRNCDGAGCLWFNQGCQPGCSNCTDKTQGDTCSEPGGTMKPTVTDQKLRTYMDFDGYDFTSKHPWRSPGYAPVGSPCGLAGGGNTRHAANGAVAPPGVKQGADGRDLPEGIKTEWAQGSIQEVSWKLVANHGGGYAYRLCPKSSALTEKCFQAHHLQFSTDQSWIQYGTDKSNRTAISAVRVSEGTYPVGSTWTKNPIPACHGPDGGVGEAACKTPPQFEPPLPGLYGYGTAICFGGHAGAGHHCTQEERTYWAEKFDFNIIDKVAVPADLEVGDYVLSFRWDCEQTPQVWAQCADITVVSGAQVIV